MEELTKIKKTLKQWESTFFKENNRKPDRDDIDKAAQDIKDAYQKYKQLKQTSNPVNEDKNEDKGESSHRDGMDIEEAVPETEAHSRDSKPWRKPDTPRRGLGPGPVFSLTHSNTGNLDNTDDGPNKLFTVPESYTSETTNVAGDTSDNSQFQIQKFGKLVRSSSQLTKENKSVDKVDKKMQDSDPYLGKFQAKSKMNTSILPKKISKLVSKHKEKYKDSWDDEVIDEKMETDLDNSKDEIDGDENVGHSWHVPVKDLIVEDLVKCDKTFTSNIPLSNSEPPLEVKNKSSHLLKNIAKSKFNTEQGAGLEKSLGKSDLDVPAKFSELDQDMEELDVKARTSIKKPSRKRKQEHVDSDVADAASDCDPTEEVEKKKIKKGNGKGKAAKPATKKQKMNTGEPLDMTHSGDVDNDEDSVGGSRPVIKKPVKAKAVSNDNFIRLNMKVKTYKRKGKHMTGPQYKRQMWKQKMKDRSKSYGDACFKCGQPGHWANKCPGKGSQSSVSKEPVLDEDFPSMQEAALMARGIKLEQKKSRDKSVPGPSADVTPVEDATSASSTPAEDRDIELEIQSEIVRTREEREPVKTAMEPLLDRNENWTETPDFVMKGLKKFGYDSFRHGQREAVMRILTGQSTLVVLSTGGGKSLCYQLPAYLYAQRSSCITLVISPLVSLMEDQVTGLPNGVRGVCLHTNMTANQRENVLSSVKDGKAQFLLVSPEAIAGGSMTLISSMASLPPVAFVCIDEAHCLSEWSHNFRPSYLRLCKVLREKLGIQCFLGLTATATLSTAEDVSQHLNIKDFKTATVRGSPIPSNLQLSVSRDEDRDEALVNLLQGDRFCTLDSIIIYCTRRDQTDKVATIIRTCLNKGAPIEARKGKNRVKLEWDAESYHAGLSPAQRKRVQNNFMSGKLRVVVATVAFGMGLDKADVRGVIHYNMPKSFESYVQEIGRAGRDGNLAQCHVFLDPEGKDLCELRRHTYANTVDYKTLKKLVQKIFPSCRCRDVHEQHQKATEEIKDPTSHTADEFDDVDAELIEACDGTNITDVGKDNKNSGGGNIEGQQIDTHESEDSLTTKKTVVSMATKRLCPGHERALPIEQTVMELDVKEEGISTLLCYLELHSSQWLENLPSVYANCKIQCYNGPGQLQTISKKCPPVAVAIAKARKDGKDFSTTNTLEFPVVEISDCMGWDSGPVKKELKLLQWDFSSGTTPKRTGVMIEFTDLSYHFRSPGDFTNTELDDVLEFLHTRVQRQEKSELRNLSRMYKSLKSVSHKNYWMCADSLDMSKNDKLKAILNEYFDTQSTMIDDGNQAEIVEQEPVPEYSQSHVIGDIHQFINIYGAEHSLTGRAIARIFHGISSPCFPAQTWGRVRRFWRSHLNVDFNELMKTATKELIMLRR